jgi:putative ABC transport system ATP-binding protein
MNNTALIDCQALNKTYRLGSVEVQALRDINLCINHGEDVAIVGPSGSGKSTLMNILGCLDTPTSGQYLLDGKNIRDLSKNELAIVRNQKIGFIFQNFNLLANASALENVMLPLFYRGTPYEERKQRAITMLEQVGLNQRIHHMPNELSGGERQRVAIARALVTEPDILLADEPTGNLDTKTGQEIMQLFANMRQAGKTVVMITHDMGLAERAERVVKIRDGRIIATNC